FHVTGVQTCALPISLRLPRQARNARHRQDIRTKRVPKHPFCISGAPGEIRTPDHQVRSLVLYPAELRARRSEIMGEALESVNTSGDRNFPSVHQPPRLRAQKKSPPSGGDPDLAE